MLVLRYAVWWRVADVLLLLAILAVAVLPAHWLWPHGTAAQIPHLDKWMHGLTFAALALWYAGQYASHAYWRIMTGLAAFGLLIELLQRMIVYRTAEWADLAANVAGIAAGLGIALAGPGGWCLRFERWLQEQRG